MVSNNNEPIKITLDDLAQVDMPQASASGAAVVSATGGRSYGTISTGDEVPAAVGEERGSFLLQGWFYLGLAGFAGALVGWAICEPAFVDGPAPHRRRAPQCRMLTPVFHPNFDEASVCIGDFWAASERLDDLITRIGRMIAYQEYNTKSPLNGLAAKWAAQHLELLPVDPRAVAPPIPATAEVPNSSPEMAASEPDPWVAPIVIESA
jgi:hypothetical protein